MKIGIDLLFILPGVTGGIQTYAVSLLEALGRLDVRNEYYLFLNEECRALPLDLPRNFHRVQCPFRAQSRLRRYLWEQLVLPGQILVLNIELMHSMAYVGPLLAPCVSLVTTHDVNFLAWGSTMGWARRLTMGGISFLLAHRAEAVLTVSAFSAEEIVRRLRVPATKVAIVSNAARSAPVDAAAAPAPSGAAEAAPYLVAFAGGDENKNIARLLEAYLVVAERLPHRLVLLGRLPEKLHALVAALPETARRRIVCTGYLTVPALHVWLRGATLLVFPSFYEGFGLPILEAQVLGLPVVCSRAASLPEVAADAAVYFDPHSTADMAEKIVATAMDAAGLARLAERGNRNARRYSWDNSARCLLKVYEGSLPTNGRQPV